MLELGNYVKGNNLQASVIAKLEYFNPDGIIKFNTNDDIEDILKQCTKQEYERRLSAVIENYERAKKYKNIFDLMYEQYLK